MSARKKKNKQEQQQQQQQQQRQRQRQQQQQQQQHLKHTVLTPHFTKKIPQPDPPIKEKNPGGPVSLNSSLSSFKTPQGYPALF